MNAGGHAPTTLSSDRLLTLVGFGSFEFQISPHPRAVLSDETLRLLQHSVIGQPVRDSDDFIDRYVIAADRDRLRTMFGQLLDHGVKLTARFQLRSDSGEVLDVSSVAARDIRPDGSVHIIGALRDTSQERREEEDLQRMQQRLTQVSRSSLLGEMSSAIAHELNQPLAAITTFAHAAVRLLERTEPPIERVNSILRDISAEALRAGDMIRRMRSLMTTAAQPELIDLRTIPAELRSQLDAVTRGGVELQVEESETELPVLIERSQIHHVILSLLQNAVEAAAAIRGKPVVKIQLRRLPHEVEIVVEDNGPGVSAQAVAHLFKPFFTTKANGTGLGLASSRSLVEAAQGHMAYSAASTGGARFSLRLPIAPSNPSETTG